MPSKLIKLAADSLTPLLTAAINKSLEENIFPDSAKIASAIPLDDGKTNKTATSIYKLLVFRINSQSLTKKSLKTFS